MAAIPDNCRECVDCVAGYVIHPETNERVYMPDIMMCRVIKHLMVRPVSTVRRLHKCPIKPEDRYMPDGIAIPVKPKEVTDGQGT